MLVSWALPKGVPTSKAKNHLAVQTEDHPMDYADFEGVIPKGQYGAGTVSIWDRGYYECEKWIAGKEVIATLTGAEDGGLGGPRRFALIHTGQANDQWLIHLMDPPGAKKGRPGERRPSGTGHDGDGDAGDGGTSEGGTGAAHARNTVQAPAAPPRPRASFSPMLASAGTLADLSDLDWQYELKWDGVRALVIGDATTIRLISRNGIDMSASYPELTDRSCWPDQEFVADGEIIAVGRSGQVRLRTAAGPHEAHPARRRREGAGLDPGPAHALRPALRGRRGPPAAAAQRAPQASGGLYGSRTTAPWNSPA